MKSDLEPWAKLFLVGTHRLDKTASPNDPAVKDAIEVLLGPGANPQSRLKCAWTVKDALFRINRRTELSAEPPLLGSPRTKNKLNQISAALKKAKISINKLPVRLRRQFSDLDLDRFIEIADKAQKAKAGPAKRSARNQRAAVREAAGLLAFYGHKPTATKHGKWDQLAVILNGGDPKRNTLKLHLMRFRKHMLRFKGSQPK